MTKTDELLGSWRHSHEEDAADSQTFRPENFAFPPSRGRTAFELKADGSATYHAIGAADGPSSQPAKWRADDKGHLQIEQAGKVLLDAQVLSAKPGQLRLRIR